MEQYFVFYQYSHETTLDSFLLMEDGAGYHAARLTNRLKANYGIKRLPWSTISCSFNPIDNACNTLKRKFHRRWAEGEKRPHSEIELLQAMMEE